MGCRQIHPNLETPVTSQYEKYHVTADSVWKIEELFEIDKPKTVTIDSETTGLHIKKDKPFMWVFGWLTPKAQRKPGFKGRVFSFEHDPAILRKVLILCKRAKITVGNNIKYDFHMMENATPWECVIARLGNVVDLMSITRLCVEAISDRDGGDSLGLKYLSEKYVDPKAKEFEKAVQRELSRINAERRNVLKALLKAYKGWGIGTIEEVFKVKTRTGVDGEAPTKIYTLERKRRWIEVPDEVYQTYKNWLEEYPPATYADVDLDVMVAYIHSDAIYALELVEKAFPVMLHRQQKPIYDMEQRLLPILFAQERVGFPVDMDYLKLSFQKLDDEIERNYRELWELVGEYFTVSQEKPIMDYFEKKNGVRPASVDKGYLKKQKGDRVAKLIIRLRRLEKWQSTYISRIMEVAQYDGRFYTQFNPYAAVSGRQSSDAQQFPKERILTEEGEAYEKEHGDLTAPQEYEIFYPRRAFVPEGGNYDEIWYFDYSQIELRVQANYTILLGKPDINLCRAYMPLYCKHYKTGEEYDYKSLKGRRRWNEKQENGETSAWLLEDGTPWTPTDVHSETAHNALIIGLGYTCHEKYKDYSHPVRPHIDEHAFQEFWRKKGKVFNFMRNYGGGAKKASETLDVDMEVAEALVSGWSAAYPEVAYYQNVVINAVRMDGYFVNMYGRRYYMSNWSWAYKIGNYNVQGSSADFLKWAMIKLDDFFRSKGVKTKMLGSIHDEIQFMKHKGEEWLKEHIKRIMEECDWMMVPVVVEVESTRTNWAEKQKMHVA